MRKLNDFSAMEWLRLQPLKIAFKQMRNDLWLTAYNNVRPKSLEPFLIETARFKGQNIALVVAFEQPWALDWLLRMAKINIADTTVLVFDNSRCPELRHDIEKVCFSHQTPYLALPANPTRHANRSHGMAMSWIFHNVVQNIKPRLFAYIDHDMIPVQNIKLAERLGNQTCYGMERHAGSLAWNLWAGYCMYDFARVTALPLNFLYDFSLGLDTGGRNWACLYQDLQQESLRFAGNRYISIKDPVTGTALSIQYVDDSWFHIGSISYNDNFRSKSEFCKNIAHALESGASWAQICDGANEPDSKSSTAVPAPQFIQI